MRKKISDVHLTDKERQQPLAQVRQGKQSARVLTRARMLLLTDEQRTDEEIAEVLHVSRGTVFRIRKRYCQAGLEAAVHDRPRSGAPPKVTGRLEAHLTALACSQPPEGQARWTLRLLADKLVELKPWLKKRWCLGKISEGVLTLYEQPYDPKPPLVCFDERPCQLIEDVLMPLPMAPGTPQREDHVNTGATAPVAAFWRLNP